ncbi:hypothetical protein [Streptosporangium sp. NBC_01639]
MSDTNLLGTDLDGADLRGVSGLSETEIRQIAKTDVRTLFGPTLPWVALD